MTAKYLSVLIIANGWHFIIQVGATLINHYRVCGEVLHKMLTIKTMAVKDRGFASMDPEKQRKIASKGGKTVSQDRQHMAAIGRKGGKAVSKNRKHMAEIGRKGGKASGRSR